jgi:hypothetical protein
MGKLMKVIHKVRAYIDGRTFGPGETAEIDEMHFNDAVHDEIDADGNVIEPAKERVPEALPLIVTPGAPANEAAQTPEPSPVPPRASNFNIGSPTVDDAAQSEPVKYDDSGVVKAAPAPKAKS